MKETNVFLADNDVLIFLAQQERCLRSIADEVAALMEKPLNTPVLLETMCNLMAKPPEARLPHLAGKNPRTIHLETQQSAVSLGGKKA